MTFTPMKPGDKYGRIAVVERAGFRGGAASFLCRCECGVEFHQRPDRIKRGIGCSSCFRLHQAGGRGDLTGSEWNGRTVLRRHRPTSYSTSILYDVACSKCGKAAVLSALMVEKKSPCHCASRRPTKVGDHFGLLVVVSVEPRRCYPPSRGLAGESVMFALTRCACGDEKWRQCSTLRNMRPMSCRQCWRRARGSVAIVPRWGVVTRLFRPGLALGTVIRQRPQKSQRRRPENVV